MSKYEVTTKSSEETQRLSERLGELVKAQDVIILEGDLGAGKTTLVVKESIKEDYRYIIWTCIV